LQCQWLAAESAPTGASLLDYIGHAAYCPDALRGDPDRFTFLLGGSDGQNLFSPGNG
jgi:hypothetical protein